MKKNKKIYKKIVFTINCEPYSQDCLVICNGTFGDAIADFKKWSKKGSKNAQDNVEFIEKNQDEHYKAEFTPNRGCAFLFQSLPHGYIMMFHHESSWIATTENVVHESLHLTHYILRRAGIELCRESEEAFTYLQGDIVRKILREIY